MELADAQAPAPPRPVYELEAPHVEKIEAIARTIYGADEVSFAPGLRRRLKRFAKAGYGKLPICVAKTQSSLSDDPKAIGVPRGWTLEVSDVRLSGGAGFVVAICGDMMLMPGLPEVPAAEAIGVGEDGELVGLF